MTASESTTALPGGPPAPPPQTPAGEAVPGADERWQLEERRRDAYRVG